MRKYLYRGKRKDTGEWETGSLVIIRAEVYIVSKMIGYHTPVIPQTVGQCAELIDKNGNDIFEGDIIATAKYGVDNGKGQNYYAKDRFMVGYEDGTYYLENRLRKFCLRPDNTCEIIGNVHDNPELLEVEQ